VRTYASTVNSLVGNIRGQHFLFDAWKLRALLPLSLVIVFVDHMNLALQCWVEERAGVELYALRLSETS